MKRKTYRETFAVDFDGVLHKYSKGWYDGTCYDPPIEGSLEALEKMLTKYYVFILTTRNVNDVYGWMKKHGVDNVEIIPEDFKGSFWRKEGIIGITNRKYAATAYIDDRAFQFENWKDTMKAVMREE